jgi:LPXTG-motif cell wall-anchored protein
VIKIKTLKFSFILLFIVCLFIPSYQTFAADGEGLIEIKPDRILFNTTKLAPGRSIEQVLTIQNTKEISFVYDSKAKFVNGYRPLFNELALSIWDSSKLVFDGKLSEFNGLGNRRLDSHYAEDLKFRISMPSHLGNEFQGKKSMFEITFIIKENIENPDQGQGADPAPGDGEGSTPTSPELNEEVIKPQRPISEDGLAEEPLKGQILPSTATSLYNLLTLGLLLMSLGIAVLLYRRRLNAKE